MYQLIDSFIESAKEIDGNIFPFIANKDWVEGKPVYYSGPYWDDLEARELIYSILKGKWLSSGEKVNKFENEFSNKFNFKHSVMVNSGSSANLVMFASLKKYFGWQDGDEIIVCACGFATTVAPIVQCGLKPIFVDIDWEDLNWNLDEVANKITKKTRAVISSPVLGNPYDIDKIVDICESNNIHLIADNCDSLGSKWKGEYLTKHAIAASCSFYPAHHICTIEGGMVSSNEKAIIDLARSFAWWGRACYCVGQQNLLSNGVCGKRFDTWLESYDDIVDHKYVFSNMGYNLKPLDLQGSVGSVQLLKFDKIHSIRRTNKQRIQGIIEKISGTRVVNERKDSDDNISLEELMKYRYVNMQASDWTEINGKLEKIFRFNNYDDVVLFANKVMQVAISQNHHPEINIHYGFVKVSITDYENGAVSAKCHSFTIAVDQI